MQICFVKLPVLRQKILSHDASFLCFVARGAVPCGAYSSEAEHPAFSPAAGVPGPAPSIAHIRPENKRIFRPRKKKVFCPERERDIFMQSTHGRFGRLLPRLSCFFCASRAPGAFRASCAFHAFCAFSARPVLLVFLVLLAPLARFSCLSCFPRFLRVTSLFLSLLMSAGRRRPAPCGRQRGRHTAYARRLLCNITKKYGIFPGLTFPLRTIIMEADRGGKPGPQTE